MLTPEPFPNWLKRRRKVLDLTREELARRAHCSVSTIRRLEAGDLRPSAQLAGLLAVVLNVGPQDQEAFVLFARGLSAMPPAGDIYSVPLNTAPITEPISGNLPAPLTSLVGRKQEVTAVCELLQEPGVRLLTLTGPPGTGKTRLSLAAAELVAVTAFPQGAFFVPLAPITDPDLVVVTIAQTLGVAEPLRAGDGLAPLRQALKEYLRPRRLLLVLDNFEQVVSAAAIVVELLAAGPGVKALVTSREVLHVYGEHEFPVPPLPLPDVNHLPTATAVPYLSRYASIRLFQERARAAKPDFRLTADNVADVARICAWLDGLPLAIEMAAAQVKWLTPGQVFAQLRARLMTLTGGPIDLTPRQQSLSGAIAWSYDLLDVDERKLFALMGVFVGGCEATAVQAVAAELGLTRWPNLLDLTAALQALVAKNLLTFAPDAEGQPRFVMLETLREFAQVQWQAQGLLTAVHQAHARYYGDLAKMAQPHLIASADLVAWLERLEREHHNLRAALTWAVDTAVATAVQPSMPAQVRFALELVENLQQFWYIRGYLNEARYWLDAALLLSREMDDFRALILNRIGKFARVQGDLALAQTCHEQALIIQEALGDELGISRSMENLAILAGTKGDYGRARDLLEQTLAIDRRNGESRPVISTLNNLAIVLRRLGDLTGAERLYQEGTQLCRESNNLSSLSYTLHGLGEVNMERGNPEAGLAYFRESIGLRQQLGDRPELTISLGAIGIARMYLGDATEAVRLFAVSERLRQELGITPAASYQAEAAAKIGQARTLLGEEAFALAWQEGWVLSLAGAVALALG